MLFFQLVLFGYMATWEQFIGLDPFGSVSRVGPEKIIRATVQRANAPGYQSNLKVPLAARSLRTSVAHILHPTGMLCQFKRAICSFHHCHRAGYKKGG